MLSHPLKYMQKLAAGDIDRIIGASLEVLDKTGIIVQSDYIVAAAKRAGAKIDEHSGNIRFPRQLINERIKNVPSEWTFHARNPKRSVKIGGSNMAIAPGYGSPFIADNSGLRRSATMADFEKFAALACASDVIDITGGLLVEPNDIPVPQRSAKTTLALITNSDKPFMGSVSQGGGAKDSIEMAKIIFGDISNKPCVMGLINISSPLHLNTDMAAAMVEYVSAGQPILLTPGILMGMTAPVTVAGALTQAFAELLGCVVISQILRPGVPVIIGLGGFGSDLRTGGTGFGRPENALAIQLGAEIARHLKIPFRCSAAVTGAGKPDCRSGYEKMMTAITAYNAGAHFCLQAAGILDSINTMSYEQFIIDLEIWSYIKRIAQPITINDETLAKDVIAFHEEGLLMHEHTIKYMRQELYSPSLVHLDNYDDWLKAGAADTARIASQKAEQILKTFTPPHIDEQTKRCLNDYMNR